MIIENTGEKYLEDLWTHKEKGGGRTRVWEGTEPTVTNDDEISFGNKLEKGGVNFSSVTGASLPPSALAQLKLPASSDGKAPFTATGVSLVLHPFNPHIPTIHMNVRYFEVVINNEKNEAKKYWWFGGGIDLTPVYPQRAQVIRFHKLLQKVCVDHGQNFATHKDECDKYFFLKHRNEMRGVGGIFFDHLNDVNYPGLTKRQLFNFIIGLGFAFNDAYSVLLQENKDLKCTKHQRDFQLFRRSRYVEFNLIYDRGTLFGLQSQGRTESILMSLPATAKWRYNWTPKPEEKAETELIEVYLRPGHDWASMN
eukprot:TRINITY_DN1986_c0_g1_i2.p1 TRINITY_DN1986_c0_g1~~TRINITY_DN1986_c0_g1_i2.p1  ORF type:complete len:352 (-),score=115.89 TRINITY_DN1986_c0_g1_i2:131-1060(-)